MPSGKYRSRTLRRVFVRTPGSRTVLHYRKRKPAKAKCGACGKILAGVPCGLPAKIKNLPKTKKRPERPYGGFLCSLCTRELIKNKVRNKP